MFYRGKTLIRFILNTKDVVNTKKGFRARGRKKKDYNICQRFFHQNNEYKNKLVVFMQISETKIIFYKKTYHKEI